MFAYAMNGMANILHTDGVQAMLDSQQRFYKKYYSWDKRKEEWINFLTGAVDAKN